MRFGAVGLLCVALGCAGGVRVEEVPSDPIAFVRQEARFGIANLGEFMESLTLRNEGDPRDERPKRLKTTVSLLTVPTGEIRPVPDSGFGTLPLDWSSDGLRLLIGRVAADKRSIQLFSWNRLTGAYDRTSPDRSEGTAALGDSPIRLGLVGRILLPGLPSERGILISTEADGVQPLPDGVGGTAPDVSPDGVSVVFVRSHPRLGREGIILLSRLGSDEARPIARGKSPKFSRDGKWITYLSRRSGNTDVWLMRSDGSSKRAITHSSYDEAFPAVSPDGRFVVYSAVRAGSEESQLFLTRVADGVEMQLTRTGQNARPVW